MKREAGWYWVKTAMNHRAPHKKWVVLEWYYEPLDDEPGEDPHVWFDAEQEEFWGTIVEIGPRIPMPGEAPETSLARRDEYKRLSDQYSDLWRVERDKAIALAAHVERLHGASENALAIIDARLPDWAEEVESLRAELDNAPKTSLAKRDAQKQFEGARQMYELLDGLMLRGKAFPGRAQIGTTALKLLNRLRRQAGGDA